MTSLQRLAMSDVQVRKMVNEMTLEWEGKREDEDVVLVSKEGDHIPSSSFLLAIFSPLLSDLLSQRCCQAGTIPVTIHLPPSSSNISTFLTLITTGEAIFDNQVELEEVMMLASALGLDLSSVGALCQGEPEHFSFGRLRGVHCLFADIGSQTDLLLNSLDETLIPKEDEKKDTSDDTAAEGEDKREYASECYQCPKMFKSRSRMKLHAMLHPNFLCHQCEKGFRFRSALFRHMSKEHSPQNILEPNRVNVETDIMLKQFRQLVSNSDDMLT